MTQAWFRVLSQLFGYVSAAVIVLVLLLSLRKYTADRALWRRVRKNLPQAGSVGFFSVISGGRRLREGAEIRVPYEGTMGSSSSCDVYIPARKVHMRSAFFWMEQDGLHMVALHRDGFLVDDVPVEPGDEAVLRDGAILHVGDAQLVLALYASKRMHAQDPYVTTARRGKAQQGKGDGIGAPGRGEERREKKLQKKQASGRKKREAEEEEESGAKRSRR